MTDDLERRARAWAVEIFEGAYGSPFDPNDASDRTCLEQMIVQERRRLEEEARCNPA